jgi:hypothetical protein
MLHNQRSLGTPLPDLLLPLLRKIVALIIVWELVFQSSVVTIGGSQQRVMVVGEATADVMSGV